MKYVLRLSGNECGSKQEYECINQLIVKVIEEIKNLNKNECNELKIKIED